MSHDDSEIMSLHQPMTGAERQAERRRQILAAHQREQRERAAMGYMPDIAVLGPMGSGADCAGSRGNMHPVPGGYWRDSGGWCYKLDDADSQDARDRVNLLRIDHSF